MKRANRFKFTDQKIRSLKPAGKSIEYWDEYLGGFGVRVSPKGVKAWTFVTHLPDGQPARFGLGRYPAVSLAGARKEAGQKADAIERGEDPRKEARERKEREERDRLHTVAAVIDDFVDLYLNQGLGRSPKKQGQPLKNRKEVERILRVYVTPAIGKQGIRSVTRQDIGDLLDHVKSNHGAMQSNRVYAWVRKLFNWARDFKGLIDASPVAKNMERGVETSRSRSLSPKELEFLWPVLGDRGYPFGHLYRWLLVTGQRLRDAANMTVDEVDTKSALWTIPATRHKSGREHIVPLSDLALEVWQAIPKFEGQSYAFSTTGETPVSGFSKAQRGIERDLEKIEGKGGTFTEKWTRHDFRRTMASEMQDMEISREVIEACEGRIPPGIAGTYQVSKLLEPKRKAMQAWGLRLQAITGNLPPNVVALSG